MKTIVGLKMQRERERHFKSFFYKESQYAKCVECRSKTAHHRKEK